MANNPEIIDSRFKFNEAYPVEEQAILMALFCNFLSPESAKRLPIDSFTDRYVQAHKLLQRVIDDKGEFIQGQTRQKITDVCNTYFDDEQNETTLNNCMERLLVLLDERNIPARERPFYTSLTAIMLEPEEFLD